MFATVLLLDFWGFVLYFKQWINEWIFVVLDDVKHEAGSLDFYLNQQKKKKNLCIPG